MATKRKIVNEKPKTVLIKPREVFKRELANRVEIGKELLTRQSQIQTLDQLDQLNKDFANWDDYNEELIKQAFNNQYSEYYYEYSRVNQMSGFFDYMKGVNTDHPQYKINEAKHRIENSLTILNRLIEKLPIIEQDSSIVQYQTEDRTFFNSGFIVHGHNDALKFEVARYIEKELKRKAIILHEEANRGQTIIEKFQTNSTVDFAVALWTTDDIGKAKTETDYHDRARQNVIFETGFFIGALGRQNVIVLVEQGVEITSDFSGVVFISLSGNWKDDLRKEIEAIYEL